MRTPAVVIRDLWLNLLHWVALYLPIALMASLALLTWWLARQSPASTPVVQASAPKHEADYFLTRFATFSFDKEGKMNAEVRGERARHFPDTDVLEIDEVRTRSIKNNRLSYGQADRAYSNGDGSEVQYVGHASIVREQSKDEQGKIFPQLKIQSEFLHFFDRTQQIKSHQPVTITRGQDQWSGDHLFYDNLEGVLELTGRVKASFHPKKP